jgi:hypothetical protein
MIFPIVEAIYAFGIVKPSSRFEGFDEFFGITIPTRLKGDIGFIHPLKNAARVILRGRDPQIDKVVRRARLQIKELIRLFPFAMIPE